MGAGIGPPNNCSRNNMTPAQKALARSILEKDCEIQCRYHKAACKADPQRFYGNTTWPDEDRIAGRKAGWEALARHWMKKQR